MSVPRISRILLGAAFLGVSLAYLFSAIMTYGAVSSLEEWDEKAPPTIGQVAAVQKLLALAETVRPLDAGGMILTGRVALWGAYVAPPDAKQQEVDKAEAAFLAAAAERPTWALPWADLARLYALKVDVKSMLSAWDKAISLGRFENYVHQKVVPAGLVYWRQLGAERQAVLRKMMKDILQRHDGYDVIRSAVAYYHESEVQPFIHTEGQRFFLDKYLRERSEGVLR